MNVTVRVELPSAMYRLLAKLEQRKGIEVHELIERLVQSKFAPRSPSGLPRSTGARSTAALAAARRELVVSGLAEGKTHQQIADEVGLTASGVRTIVYRMNHERKTS